MVVVVARHGNDTTTPPQQPAWTPAIPGNVNDMGEWVAPMELKGWYSRGYLPHFDGGEYAQMVTFCLADALPVVLLERWREQLKLVPANKAEAELRRRIEKHLDRGYGERWLNRPEIASLVQTALLHFDRQRYRLFAWVVMPNHVHILFVPCEGFGLPGILHSWKSFTAHQANRLLSRHGAFWYREYFDRFVRSARHFDAAEAYIEHNPVEAGLCQERHEWLFSSARYRSQDGWVSR